MGNQAGEFSELKELELDPLTPENRIDENDLNEFEIFEPVTPSPEPSLESTDDNKLESEFDTLEEESNPDENEENEKRGIMSKTSSSVLPSALTCTSQLTRFSTQQVFENESLIQLIVEFADRVPALTSETVIDTMTASTVINSEGVEVVRYALPSGKYFDITWDMGSNWFWPSKFLLQEGPDPAMNIAFDSSVTTLGLGVLIEGFFSTYQIYKNRKIKDKKRRRFENVKVVAKNSGSVLGSSIGVAAGTLIIPVPIVGGLVGSIVGGLVGRYSMGKAVKRVYKKEREIWKMEELGKQVRSKIISEMRNEMSNEKVFSNNPDLKEKLFGDLAQEEVELEEEFGEWTFFHPFEKEKEEEEEEGEEGDSDPKME